MAPLRAISQIKGNHHFHQHVEKQQAWIRAIKGSATPPATSDLSGLKPDKSSAT
jgi:hypothetical protein